MHSTLQYSIGGLPLPGHRAVTLGPRHPTSIGVIEVQPQVGDGIILSADVRNGFGHRGAEKLFEVRDYRSMIMLADRHDWLAAFSGELSLTLTIEAAMRLTPPPRAVILRTALAELARIHSHLSFLSYLAAPALEAELWGVVDALREALLEWAGNRVHPMLNRVGGLAEDAPAGWFERLEPVLEAATLVAAAVRESLAADDRFRALAVLSLQDCLGYGLSGPVSRAAGLDLDRRASGYLAYEHLFQAAPTRGAGDAHDRFEVLLDEVCASAAMVRSAGLLAEANPGEVSSRLSRRLKVPEGEHVTELEAPWGIAACLLVSRGGQTPWRVALRTPSFANLSALGTALRGAPLAQLADAIASLGYTIGDADK